MDYNEIQLNKSYRREAGIWAFRVLALTPEGITIQLPRPFGEDAVTEIPLTPKTKALFRIGDYVDISLSYTVTDGTANSFQAKYWGKTPLQFIPTNGENISKL